ncbi:MAG TPA: hypothetical protein VMH35_19040 [Streptosporangiaceae bacterium]|nr:hypothetical protein [Streptosporangiaceae bacterium]
MRYRAMAVTAAAVMAGLAVTACSAGGPASASGSGSTPQPRPRHTVHLGEPATDAAVRADAGDYLSLASAGQFAVTYQMLSTADRQAVTEQAWVAVHQTCAGTSYKITHLAVSGKTATVTVAVTGAGHRGTLTETLVYSAGSWGISPQDLSLYQHGTVAADVAAAKAQDGCASSLWAALRAGPAGVPGTSPGGHT